MNDGDSSNESCFSRRVSVVWIFFLVLLVIVFFRLFQIMVVQRDDYLLDIESGQAYRYEIIPAVRGRLLDASGRPLAWSARRFALDWVVPKDPSRAVREWELINTALEIDSHWRKNEALARSEVKLCLKSSLSADDFIACRDLLAHFSSLQIDSCFVRHRIAYPALRERLGEVRVKEGVEVGVSGWEKEHDSILRGQPALFRVRLDHEKKPVPGTREVLRDMRDGHDVYLPFTIGE